MARTAVQRFRPAPRSLEAPIENRDGFPAFERPVDEQYLQTLLTNTLGNTFYATGNELLAEATAMHDRMVADDPAFVSKALVYARREGYMRTQPIFGLAKLSVNQSWFPFSDVILTPNDLADFAAIVKSLRKGEGGRRIKGVAGNWLARKLTEYWVIKYGADRKAGGYSLKDLVQVYHPKLPKSPLFDYVMGREADLSKLPQIESFERLKRATTDLQKAVAITQGRLPHEVATSFAGSSKEVWNAIVPQLPVFALLRNLATLERHGVLDGNREFVQSRLTDPEVIRKSKILPFRFLDAIDHVKAAWAKDALRDALDLAFANLPEIPGRTAVFLDRSGSMGGKPILIASIFAVSLMKKTSYNGLFLLFDTELEEVSISLRDSTLTQADRIQARGGTSTDLPMRRLLADRDKVDNIILITDEQQNTGTAFIDVLDKYRQVVNRHVNTFVIDVGPYRSALLPDDPRTYFMYGWSDRVLDFIGFASRGWGSMAKVIRDGQPA